MFRRSFCKLANDGFVGISRTQYFKYKSGHFYIYHSNKDCQYIRFSYPWKIEIALERANSLNPFNRNCLKCEKTHLNKNV